jgi:hypothetical protein
MKNLIFICILIAITYIISASSESGVGPISVSNGGCSGASCYCDITVKVKDVLRGDTINVEDLGVVKLAGIICPDVSTPDGKSVKSYLESLILNKLICLKKYPVGNAESGITWAIAYQVNPDGSINTSSNINYLILDVDSVRIDPLIPGYIKDKIFGINTYTVNTTENVTTEEIICV